MENNTITLREYLEALQVERELRYQQRYEAQESAMKAAFAAAEVARAIKDQGDRDALVLAREIQTYKDEKANNLRDQITGERGLYATKQDLKAATDKIEVAIAPVLNQLALQQGRSGGLDKGWTMLIGAVGLVSTVALLIFAFLR